MRNRFGHMDKKIDEIIGLSRLNIEEI